MSLFSSSGRTRRNIRQKVVHSISDSENDDQDDKPSSSGNVEQFSGQPRARAADSGVTLSFIGHDSEEDFSEIKLKKKREHVYSQHKAKQEQKKKRHDKADNITPVISQPEDEHLTALSQLTAGVIPSAAAIHAARKKRELARNVVGEAGANWIGVKQPGNSNILSDDENSDGGEDSKSVRQFGIAQDTSKQMEVLSAIDNAASGSDEEKFIEEQLYKGSYSYPSTVVSTSVTDPQDLEDYPEPLVNKVHVADFSAPTMTAISVESLQSQLGSQLERLKDQLSLNSVAIQKSKEDIRVAENEITDLELHSQTLAMRYQFFQEMKGYIRDLLLCLTEKVPEIKKVENAAFEIEKQRSDMLLARRRQDMLDSVEECSGAATDQARQVRSVEREGRRRRRREARSKAKENIMHHNDGLSSDDELPLTVKNKFQSEKDALSANKEEIFGDVIDEFSRMMSVASHFQEWKYSFPTSYEQAYLSLCLPKLLKPYIALELIFWNPLTCSDSLERMQWLRELLFFAYQEGSVDRTDSDLQLIPRIVETIVLSRLTDFVNIWDSLSASQTSFLVKFVEQLLKDFPTITLDCQSYQNMLKAVFRRSREIMEKDIVTPTFPTETVNNPGSLQYQFCQRQFWTSYKLLGNVMKWQGILSDSTLQELVIDGLLNRHVLLSLQNCPVSELSISKVGKIISLLPPNWWRDHSGSDFPLLGLYRYLENVISVLQRSMLVEPVAKQQALRSAISEGLQLLSSVN